MLIICTNSYDNIHDSGDTAHWALNTLIWPLKVIQGQRSWGQLKDHIYDLLYVLHVNFGHNMHHSEDTAH